MVDDFGDIHDADKVRSKRLSFSLNTFKNLPDQKTIVLGDSDHHGIVGDEVHQ